MIKHEYPRLGEVVYTDKLENGLQLMVVPKKGFAKGYAFFATNYGSIDTKFFLDGEWRTSPDGVAHYLEHKMFDTPDGNALQRLAAVGASPNAFTSYEVTAYYFSVTQNFEQCLRELLSFVSVPYFTEESVEKERGIITQEIRMYEDNPNSQVGERLFEIMYHNHPVRVSIAGTAESIADITAETLYNCHKAFYDPSNMCLCVCGDFDPERIKAIAEEVLPSSKAQVSARDYGEAEPDTVVSHYCEKQMEVGATIFELGFKLPMTEGGREDLKRELIGDLAFQVLAGGSSQLFSRLYSQGLINSTFSGGYESIKHTSMIVCGGESEEPEKVRTELIAEAQRITDEGVDKDLFRRLKRSAYGRHLSDLDSFESVCYGNVLSYFDDSNMYDFADIYDEITEEDVRSFIAFAITEERAALSVIRPLEEEEDD